MKHFLDEFDGRELPWVKPTGAPASLRTDRVMFGQGENALEVAIAETALPGQPKVEDLRALFRRRAR